MGNNSTKSTEKRLKKKKDKNKKSCCPCYCCCCLCTSRSLANSVTSSSYSIDEKYFSTLDRISAKNRQQTNEYLSNKYLNTININQWIDSLPLHDTKSIQNSTINRLELIEKQNLIKDSEQLSNILEIKSNREFQNFIKHYQLKFYLEDYRNRLKVSTVNQTFKNHFSSLTPINPWNRVNQSLIDDLNLFIISPPETILPILLKNLNSSYIIHEQIRSKCYFIPSITCLIEPDDDDYKKKLIPMDRTHVVITLENNSTIAIEETNKVSMEYEPCCIFTSNDSFQTGSIRINQEKLSKDFLPFINFNPEENISYLSSNLIQQWFNTLLLVNQTCHVVRHFLTGNERHFTCMLKEQMDYQLDKENSTLYDNSLIFAALRLPPCKYLTDTPSSDIQDESSEKIYNGFSPLFLSNNKKLSNDSIHVDYEHYSFALVFYRWPKTLIESYSTNPERCLKRQWPSQHYINLIIKQPLLLSPDPINDQWKINFDFIEKYLFELMNELTLFFYILCQQLFSLTYSTRTIIKHCFLNYCENYGLPFANNQTNISDLINQFLKDLSEQVNRKYIPNYFNHEINLLHPNNDDGEWFEYINKYVKNGIDISSFVSSSLIKISNRSIVIEFLFYFTNLLYQTLQIKQSQFYLNDTIVLDLHKQVCEMLSDGNHEILKNASMNDLLNNEDMIEFIKKSLTHQFDTNAELVHSCLNQIRKAETSLIFHYTWTIFIQYLHTYYNSLWNI